MLLVLFGVGAYILGVQWWVQRHYRAAQAALGRGDLDQAQKHLDECLRIRPKNVTFLLLAARTARQRDADGEAEKHLSACEQLEPETADSGSSSRGYDSGDNRSNESRSSGSRTVRTSICRRTRLSKNRSTFFSYRPRRRASPIHAF